MSARWSGHARATLTCLTILLASAAGSALQAAAQGASTASLDNPPTTYDAIETLAAIEQARHCSTPACKGLITISGLEEIEADRDWNVSNGTARDNGQTAIAHRRIEHLLLRHALLYAPVCAMAGKIMSRIHLQSNPEEVGIGVNLMETAIDMDLRSHGHCAADLVAVLPRDPENDRIRINSRDICFSDTIGGPPSRRVCDALAEGAIDRNY